MGRDLGAALHNVPQLLRRAPSAYTAGSGLILVAILLLAVSLHPEIGVVDTGLAMGETAPGVSERVVPFRVTPLFQANLLTSSCDIVFHLLSDAEYAAYGQSGTLPPPTLDCNRTGALVRSLVGHLVIVYTAGPTAPNVTYAISVSFFAMRTPYAILSIPGAALALGATVWIAITMMTRGTDRLVQRFRLEYERRKKQ